MEVIDPAALEPHIDLTSHDICVTGTSDSSPAISSEPCASADTELDQLSIFKFSAADVFRHCFKPMSIESYDRTTDPVV